MKTKKLPKIKRSKLPTVKQTVKALDKIIWEILKETEKSCVVCGSKEKLTPGHYITRSVYALRWDLRNVHTQCWGCNVRHEHDPLPYTRTMIRLHGPQIFDQFAGVRISHTRFGAPALRALLESLKTYKLTLGFTMGVREQHHDNHEPVHTVDLAAVPKGFFNGTKVGPVVISKGDGLVKKKRRKK